jgi:transcriptional regulatory protein RtcR
MEKKKVVIGFLGTQLDSGRGAGRWEKWRPTLALLQHEDRVVERLELLTPPPHLALAHPRQGDLATAAPATTVTLVPRDMADPGDVREV